MSMSKIIEALRKPYRHLPKFNYDLPEGLVGVWLSCGASFQLGLDIETEVGADKLVFWWLTDGREQFPGVRNVVDAQLLAGLHLSQLPSMVVQGRPVLT